MSRRTLLKLSPLAMLLLLPLGWAPAPAPAGPPWISLEIPANPLDSELEGAAFVVHAYHHDLAAGYQVTGAAHGLVDGRRESIPLEMRPTSRPGVYAVSPTWPDEGDWMLTMAVGQGESTVTLIAELGPNGGIREEPFFGTHSMALDLNSIRVVDGAVGAARVDAALRTMAMR